MEFHNAIKNEFNLFISLNSSQNIQKIHNKNAYSFKRFTYETNLKSILKIYNKKDVYNRFIYLEILKSFQEKLFKNDKTSKFCMKNENFITFLKKNEKTKKHLQFYDELLPINLNSLLFKLNENHLFSLEYFEKIAEFKKDLESLNVIDDFIQNLPEGLKQIINIWRKNK